MSITQTRMIVFLKKALFVYDLYHSSQKNPTLVLLYKIYDNEISNHLISTFYNRF